MQWTRFNCEWAMDALHSRVGEVRRATHQPTSNVRLKYRARCNGLGFCYATDLVGVARILIKMRGDSSQQARV